MDDRWRSICHLVADEKLCSVLHSDKINNNRYHRSDQENTERTNYEPLATVATEIRRGRRIDGEGVEARLFDVRLLVVDVDEFKFEAE